MTALDIIVLLLVGLGVFTGLRKGFVHAVLSLGVWVLVVLALWALHGLVGQGLSSVVGTTSGGYVLAFIVIFAAAYIGGKIAVSRIAKGVRRSFAGSADRLLGALFGGLKGLVYVTLFYMAFSFVYDTIWGRAAARPDWIRNAFTYPLVHGTADTFVDLVDRRRAAVDAEPGGNRASNKAAPKTK
jgi:membrane protein required for colicin V production